MSVPERGLPHGREAQHFGAMLRYLRRRAQLTQAELARAVGYSREHLARLELGQRQPDAVVVTALFLSALGIEAEQELAAQLVQLARNVAPQTHPENISPPAIPSNIPAPIVRLIGRETELGQVKQLLAQPDIRLISLLGPPGVGKTRLAYQLAWEQRHAYADGCFVVELAGIGQAAFVAEAIAQSLGIQGGAEPVVDRLGQYLREGQRLLVLDNMEHVLPAAPLVARLLASAPGLVCMITSREPLQIDGEHEYRVQPLALPAEHQPTAALAPDTLAQVASIALFIDRARAVNPDFALTAANAAAISTLCLRLDGLPLAIELAAAQVKIMSLEAIVLRLERDRAAWLAISSRTRPERQRTLEAAIAWSYQLLSPLEQRCFARLGVFRGLFDEAAVAAIWNDNPALTIATLPMLRSLVDKNLLSVRTSDEPCFSLLETLRDYACQRLVESGEYARICACHARYFADLVEQGATPGLNLQKWYTRLELYHDNLRAALQWADTHASHALLLKLAGALGPFWSSRGYHSEGRSWLQLALASTSENQADRARALCVGAQLAQQCGMLSEASQNAEQALALYEAFNDQHGMVRALHTLGWAAVDGSAPQRARIFFERELAIQRAIGDERGIAYTLTSLAYLARNNQDYAQTQAYLAESLDLCRNVEDAHGTAFALAQQAALYVEYGDYAAAAVTYQESLGLYAQLGLKRDLAWGYHTLGEVFLFQRQLEAARAAFEQAQPLLQQLGLRQGIVGQQHLFGQLERYCGQLDLATSYYQHTIRLALRWHFRELVGRGVAGLGAVALLRSEGVRAASLLGAAQALFESVPPFLTLPDQREFQQLCEEVRSTLDEHLFAAAWDAGLRHAEELVQSCV